MTAAPMSTTFVASARSELPWLLLARSSFGGVIGVVLDHLLSPTLSRRRELRAIGRARRHRLAFDYAGRPLRSSTGLTLVCRSCSGHSGRATAQEDVQTTLVDNPWRAPVHLRDAAEKYAEQLSLSDGTVTVSHRLDVATYNDAHGAEHHQLRLVVVPTGYYDMLATNVALGPFTPVTAPLLTGRGKLAETQLSNMMGLDLTLMTKDGQVPVFLRSAGMAALERCWQTSSGETVQLPTDLDTDGRPDIFETARRGLREGYGITADQVEESSR